MLEEPILVYNFHVEDYECYYVSEQSVLVHNNNPCGNQQSVDHILSTAKKGTKTKGESIQYRKNGGLNSANNDFDRLKPNSVKKIDGGRVGKLEDGRKVVVRRNRTEGHPTLEIQSGKRRIKIRYDD